MQKEKHETIKQCTHFRAIFNELHQSFVRCISKVMLIAIMPEETSKKQNLYSWGDIYIIVLLTPSQPGRSYQGDLFTRGRETDINE